jgi:NDP-sugar pyrophosphorylase family protein
MTKVYSLSIDPKLMQHVDDLIDGKTIRNRSHAIETLLRKALLRKLNKAIILCGGSPIRVAGFDIPKAMLNLHGKPILEHSIEFLKRYNIQDIILAVGPEGEKIKKYFGDGRIFGVNISYIDEKKPLGTAGVLKKIKPDERCLVCNGDNILEVNLEEMNEFHVKNKALVTLGLVTVTNPHKYGVVEMRGPKVVSFQEKPKLAMSNLVNSGVYIIEPEFINHITKPSLERDVLPKIVHTGRVYGYIFTGKWFDSNNPQKYELKKEMFV